MPLLTAAELADVREVHELSIADELTFDLYRSPAEVAGKITSPVLTYSNLIGRKRAMTEKVSRLIGLTEPISSARLHWELKVLDDVDIRIGDELRDGATRYKVEGVGTWDNVIFAAISEVKGAA